MAAVHLHLSLPSIIRAPSPKFFVPLSVPRLQPALGRPLRFRPGPGPIFSVPQDETELRVSDDKPPAEEEEEEEEEEEVPASPEDLEYIEQIKRVLVLLRKNRDMTFGEVKLTIMIEDPRDIERKRLLGIEDPDELNRDDLVAALEDVNEGIIPKNRVALRLLAEEMIQWPDLEVEATKSKPRRSLYAKATDTGIDPREAARRLNIDWDSAAEMEEVDDDEIEVPPAVYTMPDHALHPPPQVNYRSFIYLKLLSLALVHSMALSDEFHEEEEGGYQETEKQISIDPMSLKRPPPVPPTLIKPRFISASLPCSATSSPESSPSPLPGSFKKWSNPTQQPHPAFHPSLARRHYTMQSKNLQCKAGIPLPRSKSCGDGRSSQPSDEFDIMSRPHKRHTVQPMPEVSVDAGQETHGSRCTEDENEGQFKCGAMCLFLPGLAKKKHGPGQIQTPPLQEMRTVEKQDDDNDEEKEENRSMASRVASLERFECASWSAAVILDDIEDDGINAYFDLPLELIRGSTDDAHSPVRTAFVFDGENKKGVLKTSNSRSGPRKSHEIRHVRFSTSQPVSYPQSPNSGSGTPRYEPREEFNAALLEAQNAHINF